MKENDLRRAFAKITPEESLINSTVQRVKAERYNAATDNSRSKAPRAFVYRMAAAVCAFVMTVGIGIGVGKDTLISRSEDTPAAYRRASFSELGDMESLGSKTAEMIPDDEIENSETVNKLLDTAEQQGGVYSVAEAILDACYFVPDENGEREGKVCCALSLKIKRVCGGTAPLEVTDIAADIIVSDGESASRIANMVGGSVAVTLRLNDNGGWMVSDYTPQ